MPRKKKEEVAAVENIVAEAVEAPVKKTRKPRAKKEVTARGQAGRTEKKAQPDR